MKKRHRTSTLFFSLVIYQHCFADSSGVINQQSVMDSNLQQQAAVCAQGDTPGTVGYAIKQAVAAHTELAAATPAVESLFDVDSACFSGLTNLFDLSFAIPSLGSIMSSAENAVIKYSQKKVCSAVDKVTGMVSSPVNSAIDNIKSYSSIDNALSGGMDKLDPQLGSSYHNSSSSAYKVNVNPFDVSNNTVSVSLPSNSSSSSSTNSNNSSGTTSTGTTDSSNYLDSIGGLFK